MVSFPKELVAAEHRRVMRFRLANCAKLLALVASVIAIITYGVLA